MAESRIISGMDVLIFIKARIGVTDRVAEGASSTRLLIRSSWIKNACFCKAGAASGVIESMNEFCVSIFHYGA